jgi:hypothetical protein
MLCTQSDYEGADYAVESGYAVVDDATNDEAKSEAEGGKRADLKLEGLRVIPQVVADYLTTCLAKAYRRVTLLEMPVRQQ